MPLPLPVGGRRGAAGSGSVSTRKWALCSGGAIDKCWWGGPGPEPCGGWRPAAGPGPGPV